MKARNLPLTGLAVLCAAALASCAGTIHVDATGAAASSPSSSPSPAASAPATASDVLFTITADERTKAGATVHLVETATAPTAETDLEKALFARYDGECAMDLQNVATPVFLLVTAKATVTSGTADAANDQVVLYSGSQADPPDGATEPPMAFSDGYTYGEAWCSGGSISVPADVTGAVAFPDGVAPTDPRGWASMTWGFSGGTVTNRSTGAGDAETAPYTVTSCSIAMGPAAAKLDLGAAWRTPVRSDATGTCSYGAAWPTSP